MFPICDIVIYNKDIVGLHQKPLEFPDLSLKGVFCYVNDVALGQPVRGRGWLPGEPTP